MKKCVVFILNEGQHPHDSHQKLDHLNVNFDACRMSVLAVYVLACSNMHTNPRFNPSSSKIPYKTCDAHLLPDK
jgi:hypothetical protein